MSLFVRWMNLYIQNMLLTIVDHCVTLSLPAAVQAHLPTKPDAKPAALPLVTNPSAVIPIHAIHNKRQCMDQPRERHLFDRAAAAAIYPP